LKIQGNPTKIQYISHGECETGGYAHERFFAASLSEAVNGSADGFTEIRFHRNFKGPFRWFVLALKAFLAADRNAVVITVSRLAWPVRFKQFFGTGKTLLVLHNYDPADGKPRLYYRLLDGFLHHAAKKTSKIQLVVVARYWQNFFHTKFGLHSVLFPNFFDAKTLGLVRFSVRKNPKMVHFGMYSDKIDIKKYLVLFHLLKKHGFVCYFSSPRPVFFPDLPVSVFENRGDYLKQVAGSVATIILNKIDEGWNRVAHESILLGTPVIASPGGGLEELVLLSGGVITNTPEDVVTRLLSGLPNMVFDNAPFEPSNRNAYLKPIMPFINSQP
jgi:glycosyltransferase involved in cell wall biosynthesis